MMSRVTEPLTDFERNARSVLEESVARIDARTRSRLNQARQAALEAAAPRPRGWRSTFMPAAGAAVAATLVGLMLWHHEPRVERPLFDGRAPAAEDVDLLADSALLSDSDALDLMEGWDGNFYEWAAAQTDGNGEIG